jgi:sarcosine oxidase, subunit alpha
MTVDFDGKKIPAHAGQTVAAALLESGVRIFSRSVKYHRPRGPFCFAGRCSHCLMRINGVPNVTVCRAEVTDPCHASVQNVIGSGRIDMLGTIDWLFPRGLDHHEMFAGVPIVEKAVSVVARHLAGLGKLPDSPASAIPPAEELHCVVAVIGAGPSGIAFAEAASSMGDQVVVFDEEPAPGGLAGWIRIGEGEDQLKSSLDDLRFRGIPLRKSHSVIGFYRDERGPFVAVVAMRPELRVLKVYPRVLGVCTGGHEPLWAFPGNDLPGIYAGRGLARFVTREKLACGKRVLVVDSHGDAVGVAAAIESSGGKVANIIDLRGGTDSASASKDQNTVRALSIEAARGSSRVEKLIINDGARSKTLACDAVALCGPTSPSFELASQAGCTLSSRPDGGFVVTIGPDGSTSVPGVFAAGHVAGSLDAAAARIDGHRAGAGAARFIKRGGRLDHG